MIPLVFSRATIEHMEKKVITKSVRTEVGETLSHRVLAVTEYPTPEEYTAICRALITKYPILADSCGSGYVSLNADNAHVSFFSLLSLPTVRNCIHTNYLNLTVIINTYS